MKELIDKYVGKKATVNLGGLIVEVKITDIKMSYGKEHFQITPVAGSNKVWVQSVSLIK